MLPFLLTSTILLADANQNFLPPPSESNQICLDMEHDLQQSVEFDIITQNQYYDILIRCYINYS